MAVASPCRVISVLGSVVRVMSSDIPPVAQRPWHHAQGTSVVSRAHFSSDTAVSCARDTAVVRYLRCCAALAPPVTTCRACVCTSIPAVRSHVHPMITWPNDHLPSSSHDHKYLLISCNLCRRSRRADSCGSSVSPQAHHAGPACRMTSYFASQSHGVALLSLVWTPRLLSTRLYISRLHLELRFLLSALFGGLSRLLYG